MNSTHFKYLFFVTKPYSFSILEPIQHIITESNCGKVKWFLASSARNYSCPGDQLKSNEEVLNYHPDAVLVPGNIVPHFWPGLKVQIFHGLGEEKRGHYRITHFFDLYCTPGPYMTKIFESLADKYQTFMVRETGWPKMDYLQLDNQHERKVKFRFGEKDKIVLYAPTFSSRYSSANDLYNEIRMIAENKPYKWLVKFHPLMAKELVKKYEQIINQNFRIIKDENILPYMEVADLLLTDTSSVAYEFLPFDRPIITYKATTRKDKGINIINPNRLKETIIRSIKNPEEYSRKRKSYLAELHPYVDGQSATRIINCISEIISTNALKSLRPKKQNWLQKRKIRKLVS